MLSPVGPFAQLVRIRTVRHLVESLECRENVVDPDQTTIVQPPQAWMVGNGALIRRP